MLFTKRRKSGAPGGMDLEAQLGIATAREAAYRTFGDACLGWLKDFALDEADIDSAGFHQALEALRTRLREMDEAEQAPPPLKRYTGFIPEFIARQRQHLAERDSELRDVVSVLTSAVVDMTSRNSAHNATMQAQLENMTALSRLEDIRRLRAGLVTAISEIKEIQKKKEAVESTCIQSLSGQVESLRDELEMAQEEARRDGLTGTYNRRALDWRIESMLDAGGSRKGRFCLLLLDLDSFKEVNDQFGHPVGDRVLLALVEICRSVIRTEDFFARYGGDEFAIVFSGASARVVARKGREICDIVSSRLFTVEDGPDEGTLNLSLSVSVGVTESQAGESYSQLMKRADDALYAAKRAGKNCVRIG